MKKIAILNGIVDIKKNKKSEIISKMESLLNEEQLEIITDVLDEYGDKSAYYLECLTHEELPWIEARKGCGGAANSIIKDKSIKEYYTSRLDK